jgi:hypothetical protein
MSDDLPRRLEAAANGFVGSHIEQLLREAAARVRELEEAAKPFADHGWFDAELEDDNCQLVKHSGPITVGHWRQLRAALREGGNG